MSLRLCLLLGCCLLAACSDESTPAPATNAARAPAPSNANGEPTVPLSDGDHAFQLKDAEFPAGSIDVDVNIRAGRIRVVNPREAAVDGAGTYPAGLIEEGKLMWHAASKQWIIAQQDTDITAPEVGGCSDGPSVVDLAAKVYWTC